MNFVRLSLCCLLFAGCLFEVRADPVTDCKMACLKTSERCESIAEMDHTKSIEACTPPFVLCRDRCDGTSPAVPVSPWTKSESPSSSGTSSDGQISPIDAQSCISSTRRNNAAGYIDWTVKNSCDQTILFDFDDCDPDPSNMQPVCQTKTTSVRGHDTAGGSNFKQPANARNYRGL